MALNHLDHLVTTQSYHSLQLNSKNHGCPITYQYTRPNLTMLCKSTVSAIALSCLIGFSHSTDVKCAPSGSIQTADLFSLLTSVATNDFSPQVPDPLYGTLTTSDDRY